MRLNISHRTVYQYQDAPTFSAQVLRLTPRNNVGQQVLRWRIDTVGGVSPWIDAFGNTCHTQVLDDPPERLETHAYGEVITTEVNGALPGEPGDLPLEVFLKQTVRTRPEKDMLDFARSHADALAGDRIAGLHALMAAIRDRIDYEIGPTDADSTAAESFATGRGVCQDHAHVFIGCARELKIPARYVSGYLYDGEQDAPQAASHAWAAAWVDHVGWVSFDVANRISTTVNHVSTAFGLDYDSASPLRGIRTGGARAEILDVSVQVSASQQ